MTLLLKDLLKENESTEQSPLKVQIYLDMDGVLVDLDGGFKKISGGLSIEDFRKQDKYKSDKRSMDRDFWKLVNRTKNFWLNLDPMPDAHVLWDFVKSNFKDPQPVILSAGQGSSLIIEKTQWIKKHIDPSIKVIISSIGKEKYKYSFNKPMTTNVLIDDTQVNIDTWDDVSQHRIGILHKDAASSINQLKNYITQ